MEPEMPNEAARIRDRQCTEPLPRRRPASGTRVFPAAPRADRYFASETAERVRAPLVRCVERADGPALLIGASGSGKSLMLAVLAESFRYRLSVATLPGGLLRTARELHQAVLYALGLPFRGLDEGELRLELVQRLESDDDAQEGVLLLVDEAQSLSVELLEELRMLTNVVRDGTSQVRLVLAGTPILEEVLTDPLLESFQQRIATRAYLQTMSRAETSAYIQGHLAAAQRDVKLFAPDALDEVFEFTEGLPRLVNQLCDHAIQRAASAQQTTIDAALIREAWSDLQQFAGLLPSATVESPPDSDTGEEVIEFGAWQDSAEMDTSEAEAGDGHGLRTEAAADADHPFGIVGGGPDEQIEAITEQIESLRRSDSSSPGGEQPELDCSDIDFSLPDDKWPEVEVVVRDALHVRAGEFREEEVLSDPFQTAGYKSGWSIHADAVRAKSDAAQVRLAMESMAMAIDFEPLSSVPLMLQVQTDLYTPDPVLPDETAGGVAVALNLNEHRETAGSVEAGLTGPVGWYDPGSTQPPQRCDPPAAAPRRPVSRPVKKRFATLFSSLQR